MTINKKTCPICNSSNLFFKHEASYVYSYVLDSDAPGSKNDEIFSPYLYDRREQTSSSEYVECENCKTRFSGDLIQKYFYPQSKDSSDFII